MKKFLLAPLWIHVLVSVVMGGGLALLIAANNERNWDENLRYKRDRDIAQILGWCTELKTGSMNPREALVRARYAGNDLFVDKIDDLDRMSKFCAASSGSDFLVKRKLHDYVPIISCAEFEAPGGHLRYALRELACEDLHRAQEIEWEPTTFLSYLTVSRLATYSLFPIAPIFAGLIFMMCFAGRTVFRERHLGWKRIAVLSSPIAAVATGIGLYVLDPDLEPEQSVLAVFGALVLLPTAILKGRSVMHWVRVGFLVGDDESKTTGAAERQRSDRPDAANRPDVRSRFRADAHEGGTTEWKAAFGRSAFWPRCLARIVDLFFAWLVVSLVLAPASQLEPSSTLLVLTATLLEWLAIAVAVLLYDFVFLSTIGTTPGKWLFGLRVGLLKDGSVLPWDLAFRRSLAVLTNGLVLMVFAPYAQAFGAYSAYKWLATRNDAKWDARVGSQVFEREIGGLRFGVGFAVAASLLIIVIVGQQIAKEETRALLQDRSIQWDE